VLIIAAILLLFLVPAPWNVVAFAIGAVLWVLELIGWNQTVKRRRRVVGAQTLIGQDAIVTEPCRPKGQVRLSGETWSARCAAGAGPGETVRVVGREGLTLIVEPVAPA
jgi:membrane-bound serine protease (ClpP class)